MSPGQSRALQGAYGALRSQNSLVTCYHQATVLKLAGIKSVFPDVLGMELGGLEDSCAQPHSGLGINLRTPSLALLDDKIPGYM
jgi:hypothetical protein